MEKDRAFSHVDAHPDLSDLLVAYLLAAEQRLDVSAMHAIGRLLAPAPPGGHVLDAGCGVGGAALKLAQDVGPEGTVVGIDLSETMVAVASGRAVGPVRFEVGDVTALSYPDGEFDLVRCERVLQHVSDVDLAVRELVRVCRPGGRVLLLDTDWTTLAVDPDDPVLVRGLSEFPGRTPHKRSGFELRGRLVRAGCREVHVVPHVFVLTSQRDAAGLLPMFDPGLPAGTPLLADDLRPAWFAALAAAEASGELFVTFTAWVAAGRR